jgi:hypothetical protein
MAIRHMWRMANGLYNVALDQFKSNKKTKKFRQCDRMEENTKDQFNFDIDHSIYDQRNLTGVRIFIFVAGI